ncbi:MAG TPA: hypothetical protein VKF81_00085 [Blastocatellia bacterium]|nr:hypothetical protein [Blastocatellia bacterium]
MNRLLFAAFCPVVATFVVSAFSAEPNDNAATEALSADDLKELSDPTILTRRVWLETEWNKFTNGTSTVEETLAALWAWRVTDSMDWAVRLRFPVKFRAGSDDPGLPDVAGLGDIKPAIGATYRINKAWRVGGGLELSMPSGRHEVSDNVWRVQEFGAMAWDLTPWLTISPSFEYNESAAEEGSTRPLHFIEVFYPATFVLPRKWAITAQYELKADFENDNYITHSAKLLVAKELENVPLSLGLSLRRSFDSGENEFRFNFIVSYYFR